MNTLDELGIKHGTDKSSQHHNYLINYEKILGHLKDEKICLFELGWGGYTFSDRGGQSARMWNEYFPNAQIACLELYEKNDPPEERIHLYQGSQDNESILSFIMQGMDPLIVIDDASHINSLCIKSFEIIYPLLKSGGIYIVEDVHTSYWDDLGADGTDFGGGTHENTTINYFKYLIDCFNAEEAYGKVKFKGKAIEWEISKNTESISFYGKFIVIKKK